MPGNQGGVQTAANTSGNAQSVSNMTQSNRGPLAVPISPDWTVQTSYLVDLSIQNAFGTIDMVQTLFIDNSLSTVPFYAINQVSQQTIICPAGAQGYFPFLCPQPSRFTIASTGGVKAPIEVLNFPVQPAVWSASQQGFKFDNNGNLLTSDATLAQVGVTGAALNVSGGGGGGGADPEYATVQAQAFADSTPTTLFDPTNPPAPFVAGTRFLLHSASLMLPPGLYASASHTASYFTFTLFEDGKPAIITYTMWVPGAAPALVGITPAFTAIFPDLDILSFGTNRLRFNCVTTVGDGTVGTPVIQASVKAVTP